MSAESISIESDDCGFELHFVVDEEPEVDERGRMIVNIQGCDLDAFYDQVKGRIGPYLREAYEARRMAPVSALHPCGYDVDDPKHPRFHSVHADLWDSREGK